ncbi:MAG: hemerythrin domain-containing protein [Duncaniella sp.]|nr:hemerythrin domain-containing protein [Bacteroides sp.]MDE6038030.1 hemerythrin domain-containing protein [Duncaniella sp.]
MKISRKFNEQDSVVDLINEDYDILPVLSRFSLPLGFGSKTIGELCRQSGINTEVFLLIVNFLLSGHIDTRLLDSVSAFDVAEFLHNSHNYYLQFKYPHIRTNLLTALDPAHADINPIIVKYFDDYIAEVGAHFNYEEHTVFPYVKALASGTADESYNIGMFTRRHDHEVEEKLSELKNIILRYYSTSVPYRMYDVLVDIYNCEEDLKQHAQIEDHILVPLIKRLEKR